MVIGRQGAGRACEPRAWAAAARAEDARPGQRATGAGESGPELPVLLACARAGRGLPAQGCAAGLAAREAKNKATAPPRLRGGPASCTASQPRGLW